MSSTGRMKAAMGLANALEWSHLDREKLSSPNYFDEVHEEFPDLGCVISVRAINGISNFEIELGPGLAEKIGMLLAESLLYKKLKGFADLLSKYKAAVDELGPEEDMDTIAEYMGVAVMKVGIEMFMTGWEDLPELLAEDSLLYESVFKDGSWDGGEKAINKIHMLLGIK